VSLVRTSLSYQGGVDETGIARKKSVKTGVVETLSYVATRCRDEPLLGIRN
jgi:hypothetical protein